MHFKDLFGCLIMFSVFFYWYSYIETVHLYIIISTEIQVYAMYYASITWKTKNRHIGYNIRIHTYTIWYTIVKTWISCRDVEFSVVVALQQHCMIELTKTCWIVAEHTIKKKIIYNNKLRVQWIRMLRNFLWLLLDLSVCIKMMVVHIKLVPGEFCCYFFHTFFSISTNKFNFSGILCNTTRQ